MKKLFFIFAITAYVNVFSQDELVQLLHSRYWFTKGDLSTKEPLVLTSAPDGKGPFWHATFLENGKFMRCDSIKQDITESEETMKYERYQCDSSSKLTIRAHKVRIVQSGASYYYKIIKYPVDPKTKMEKLELAVLDPQMFFR
jgi:hypothetical protein